MQDIQNIIPKKYSYLGIVSSNTYKRADIPRRQSRQSKGPRKYRRCG